jgi:hypothetical protein
MWIIEIGIDAARDDEDDDLKELLLDAYQSLRTDPSVVSVHMWAAIADDRATFRAIVDEAERSTAEMKAIGAVRCALHAAGAQTPGWPERIDERIDASERVTKPLLAAV